MQCSMSIGVPSMKRMVCAIAPFFVISVVLVEDKEAARMLFFPFCFRLVRAYSFSQATFSTT